MYLITLGLCRFVIERSVWALVLRLVYICHVEVCIGLGAKVMHICHAKVIVGFSTLDLCHSELSRVQQYWSYRSVHSGMTCVTGWAPWG